MSADVEARLIELSGENDPAAVAAYQNPVQVDAARLRNMGVSKQSCQQFAATLNVSPLNLIEFFQAVPHFPVVFTKQEKHFSSCAVFGLDAGENLFIDTQGQWSAGVYQPAFVRRYPFITQAITPEESKLRDEDIQKPIFVDETALDKNASSLFIANSTKTDEWKTIESFVSEYISAERQTLLFTTRLAELDLLQPFDAQIHQRKGDMLRLKGLYRVNEDKLNQLPGDVVKALMQSGELSRIYAHLISLENFAKLLDRKATTDRRPA